MDRKKLLLLVGALAIAIVTAMMARSMFAGASAPQAEAAPAAPQGPKVLVAQRVLPTGTIITADAIGFQPWPAGAGQGRLLHRRRSRHRQAARHRGALPGHRRRAGDARIAGQARRPRLPRRGARPRHARRHRSGVGQDRRRRLRLPGRPGRPGADPDRQGRRRQATQGVGNHPSQHPRAGDRPVDHAGNRQRQDRGQQFRTVTLEVTPKIAEKVAVAQTIGTLSLSLRSIADSQTELERAIAQGDIKIPDGATPEQEEKLLRAAMNRPSDGATTYQTGGDVSRFQRRTLPPLPRPLPLPADPARRRGPTPRRRRRVRRSPSPAARPRPPSTSRARPGAESTAQGIDAAGRPLRPARRRLMAP